MEEGGNEAARRTQDGAGLWERGVSHGTGCRLDERWSEKEGDATERDGEEGAGGWGGGKRKVVRDESAEVTNKTKRGGDKDWQCASLVRLWDYSYRAAEELMRCVIRQI